MPRPLISSGNSAHGLSAVAAAPAQPAGPVTPSQVGDGVSKVGGCSAGQVGCLELPSITSTKLSTSGTPRLTVAAYNTYGTNSSTVAPTKTFSSGKWYWEATLVSSAVGGSYCFGAGHPNVDIYLNRAESPVLPRRVAREGQGRGWIAPSA